MGAVADVAPEAEVPRGDGMLAPDEVAAMRRLKQLRWGVERIAREFGFSHTMVRPYIAQGGFLAYGRPERRRALDGLEGWLRERFRRHAGNADVMRQELASEKASP